MIRLKEVHAGKVLLYSLAALALLAFAGALLAWQMLFTAVIAACVVLLLATLVEWHLARKAPPLTLRRSHPAVIAVNRPVTIRLTLSFTGEREQAVELFDFVPGSMQCEQMPLRMTLVPGEENHADYTARPLERGVLGFPATELRLGGPLGLLRATWTVEHATSLRVYPDFSRILTYTLLATANHVNVLGIRRKQRRGDGSDFHQMRPYRPGDSLRQISWKATSKRHTLISQEYQEERDQQIIIMVDSGRRMRTQDDELTHFDHALNALMLVCYIALEQGDSVGVLSFGNSRRWIPPGKGKEHTSVILNGLFDLQAGNHASDFVEAGIEVLRQQQKRAMVILLTNTRDEDTGDLMQVAHMLRRRHLLLLANIRERFLDEQTKVPVTDFQQALRYASVRDYLQRLAEVRRTFSSAGVHNVDCTADKLAVTVANSYLEMKSAGIL